MQRNAYEKGEMKIDDIQPRDYRKIEHREEIKKVFDAVIILAADISGSRDEFQKYIEATFCWLLLQFVQDKYTSVETVFVVHDTEAEELTKDEYFHRGAGGGTTASSAQEKMLDIISERYPPSLYNIYVLYFSDGYNWSSDNPRCIDGVNTLLNDVGVNLYAYIQTVEEGFLFDEFEQNVESENYVGATITNKDDVLPVFSKLFKT
jgi:uncharacterized protein